MNPSPLGSFPELAQAYASSFAQGEGQLATAADRYNTDAAESNRKESIKARIQQLQNISNPDMYKKVKKADGGFDFFDPEGNQIDIATAATRTGRPAWEWIKDSENPIDIQYRNDYSNLQDFMNALASKNQDKINQFKASDPNLGRYTSDRGGIDALMRDFRKVYKRYYDPSSWGAAPSKVAVPAPQSGSSYGLGSGDSIGQ